LRLRASSPVIGQAEALSAQPLPENPVVFPQVVNDGLLIPIDPAGCRYDQ
jgi:hypothetical protein